MERLAILYQEIYLRWIGIVFIGLIFPFIVDVNMGHLKNPTNHYWVGVGFSTFYTAICWNSAVQIMCFFRKRYSGYYQTKTRLLHSFPAVIVLMFFVNIVLAYVVDVYILDCPFVWAERWRIPIIASVMSVALCAVYEGVYIYQQLQESILEAQKFQTEHIKSQFEVLKNQIDPHFLFNSLNTLASIITENPNIAVNFAEKLSQVYRYILQNKDKEVVPLNTEIMFVKSYVFLLQTRFEQNLLVNFEVGEAYLGKCIPPLSLQILVENAIKHNIVSNDKPLRIDIYIDGETSITVRNNLQPKRQVLNSTKIGLDNIVKRYQYLTERAVEILPTPQTFTVSLPLLNMG